MSSSQSIGNVDIGDTEKPRNLAIHPLKRLLFWTDVGSRQAIYRGRLDGNERVSLMSHLDGISAICVDPDMNMIFYAHGKKIDVMDLNGASR